MSDTPTEPTPDAAATAVEAEATAAPTDTIDIEWRGQKFQIPAAVDDWPIAALEAFEYGRAAAATRGLLGEVQWAKLKRLGPKVKDLNEFCDLVADVAGFDNLGNS